MYLNMKNYENIYNCLRVIQQNKNRKLKSANCWQQTSLKEHHTVFSYIAVLNTPKLNSHLKAIHNDPECPLLLHHLNNVYKKFGTKNAMPKSMEYFLHFLKIMKL